MRHSVHAGEVCFDQNTTMMLHQRFAHLLWCWLLAVSCLSLSCMIDSKRQRPTSGGAFEGCEGMAFVLFALLRVFQFAQIARLLT